MLYELTVTAPNQSGFFSRIMVAARRRGCQPIAQKREVHGEAQVVNLTLEGTDTLLEILAADIEALGTSVQLSPSEAPGASRTERQILEPDTLPESGPAPSNHPSPTKPKATIRVGRQVIEVDEPLEPHPAEEKDIKVEPILF